MRLDLLTALNTERAARRAAVLVTELAGGKQRLVRELEIDKDPLATELRAQLRAGKSGVVERTAARFFTGADAAAAARNDRRGAYQPGARADGEAAGYDVTIVDPRTAFATPERFPDVQLLAEWPEDGLPKVGSMPVRRSPRSRTIRRSTSPRSRPRSSATASMSARSARENARRRVEGC